MLAPVLALTIFVVAFYFIATERADKVKTVLVAAGLMTLLGLTPGSEIFYSEHEGIDWNVIFLLLGMMVIVGIIKQTGLFDFLAIWAAKRSRGKPFRLMVMLMLITAYRVAGAGQRHHHHAGGTRDVGDMRPPRHRRRSRS